VTMAMMGVEVGDGCGGTEGGLASGQVTGRWFIKSPAEKANLHSTR
jgi:hypothetical protein